MEDHIYWFEVPRQLHVAWTRVSEPVSWIAERTDAFLRGLGSDWGINEWVFPEGDSWRGSNADLERLVESQVQRNSDGTAVPLAGYFLFFVGAGNPLGAEVIIGAGASEPGNNLPLHTATVHPRPRRDASMTSAMVDDLCDFAIRVWQPARVAFSSADILKARKAEGRRAGGWYIDPAWRLWLSDETATIDFLADGVTATRMHGGTMLRAPDDWTAEQVIENVGETLDRNGITEIPR